MNASDCWVFGVSHSFHVPHELDWPNAASSVVEARDIRVEGDTVELLSEEAILRLDSPLPLEGVTRLDLLLSQIPSTPGPDGSEPTGTVFSNRTTSSVPEKGWPTLRVEVSRNDANTGRLSLRVAYPSPKSWQVVTSPALLQLGKWVSVLISWGEVMSLALVEAGPQDARHVIISSKQVGMKPIAHAGIDHFGLGRVDNPYDHGQPHWTPPSLAGAKIRITGVSLGPDGRVKSSRTQ